MALMIAPIKYNVNVKLTLAWVVPGNALSNGVAIPPGIYHPIPKQNIIMHNESNAGILIFVIGLETSLVACIGVG